MKVKTKQVRWTTEFPEELLGRALVWGLRQKPPLRGYTPVLTALIRRGLRHAKTNAPR